MSAVVWADDVPMAPYATHSQTVEPLIVPPATLAPPTYYPPPVPPPADPYSADGCSEGCPDPQPYAQPVIPPPYLAYPPPIVRRDNRRVRLIAGGITLFATSWVSATVDAAFGTTPYVIIPLAGPIIATVDYQRNYVHTGSLQFESALLVIDAAAQTAGVIMAIVGAAMKPSPPNAPRVSWAGTGVKGTF